MLVHVMSDTTINIYGGNNQILPNATEAVQNFYDSRLPEASKIGSSPALPDDCPESKAVRLIPYLNNKETLEDYLAQLRECRSASELARIILTLCEREDKITQEEIVKERFISLFLPLVHFTHGKTVGNIRARINEALANRPRYININGGQNLITPKVTHVRQENK